MAGGGLGIIFFGGLWWTVRKGVAAPYPALWFFGSGLLRMSMVVAGFYLVGGGQWRRLVACLVGFIIARGVVAWLLRPAGKTPERPGPEASHAP